VLLLLDINVLQPLLLLRHVALLHSLLLLW
jgi:hypothetical protein